MNIKIALLTSLLLLTAVSNAGDVAVIVNKDNHNVLSKFMIMRIYLNKIRAYPDGTRIVPYRLEASNEIISQFHQRVLRKSDAQIIAYWTKLHFTGTGQAPTELTNTESIVEKVVNNMGAMGFVDAEKLRDDENGIKIIARF